MSYNLRSSSDQHHHGTKETDTEAKGVTTCSSAKKKVPDDDSHSLPSENKTSQTLTEINSGSQSGDNNTPLAETDSRSEPDQGSEGKEEREKPSQGEKECIGVAEDHTNITSRGDDSARTSENPTQLRQRRARAQTSEKEDTTKAKGGQETDTEERKEEETKFGSVQHRKKLSPDKGVFQEFLRFYGKNKVFVMSTVAVGGVSGFLGILFGLFVGQTLFGNQTTHIISSNGSDSWELFQKALQEREQKLQLDYEHKFKSEMAKFNLTYTKEMTSKTEALLQTKLQKEIDEAKRDITSDYETKLEKMDDKNTKMIENAKTGLVETFNDKVNQREKEVLQEVETKNGELKDQIDKRLALEPDILNLRGFMNIETFGPIMLILPLLEILVVMFCWRFFTRNPTMPRQNDAAHHNGNAGRIQTDNKNVALLCFRNGDEEIVNRWADELLQSCNSKPRKRVHVIESLDDVTAIPPCRAALVFVDPDEREMIIEDERHHIGMGLRRQAVQRLLDSGVEVFIVVYHDKNKNDLTSGQMYNRKLGQIGQHAQLKQLKGQNRVFSLKDSLKPWQSGQIVSDLDAIFSQR